MAKLRGKRFRVRYGDYADVKRAARFCGYPKEIAVIVWSGTGYSGATPHQAIALGEYLVKMGKQMLKENAR